MFKLTPVIMALAFGASTVFGQALGITDTEAVASCGLSQCCQPQCHLSVNVPGCTTGTVDYSANCLTNFQSTSNGGTRDIGGCAGWTSEWVSSGGARGVQIVNGDQFFGFWVPSCDAVTSEGGSQCVPSGGGCKTQYS